MLRLNDLPMEVKNELDKQLSIVKQNGEIMEPFKEYDEWGLRFPIDYLNRIGYQVILLPLEYLAEYVDIITKTNIDENNISFIENTSQQLSNLDPNFNLIDYNATGLGNLAYVSLFCKNKNLCKKAEMILDQVFEKLIQLLDSNLN